jgi:hypothetical protein
MLHVVILAGCVNEPLPSPLFRSAGEAVLTGPALLRPRPAFTGTRGGAIL